MSLDILFFFYPPYDTDIITIIYVCVRTFSPIYIYNKLGLQCHTQIVFGFRMGWDGLGCVEVGFGLSIVKLLQRKLKISSFPKRFYNPSGRVAGW